MNQRRRTMMRGAMLGAGLALLAPLPTVAAFATDQPPSAARCVQAAETPLYGGAHLESTPSGRATIGFRCEYTSSSVGGYRAAPGSDWQLIIDRPDGRRLAYSSGLGSPHCADTVIRPGDVVRVASHAAVAAGEAVGC